MRICAPSKIISNKGFIRHTGNRSIEDVAEDYLEELIDRSLIQVSRRVIDGGIKKCRIHDLLRDFCISESKEDKFLELLRAGKLSFPIKSRRLSFHGDGSFPLYHFPSFSDLPCGRSLLFFRDVEDIDWNLFIRVLNFEQIKFHSIPESIETMIHLRYSRINLPDTAWVILDSIGNLRNLETLFIESRYLASEKPISGDTGICKLQHLRNLYVQDFLPLPYHFDEALWNLQVLSSSTCWYDGEQTFAFALDKFPCVRELTIRFIYNALSFEEDKKAVDFLEGLRHLRYLQILRIEQFLMLPRDSSPFPLTITQLTLKDAQLIEGGGIKLLGNLPNLRILKIKGCGISILHVFGVSFPRLEVLKLRSLERVKEWKQEEGVMPCLKYLVISGCHNLTKLPPELWSLTALQKVEVLSPNPELAHVLQELQMKVRCKLVIGSIDLQPSSSRSSADFIHFAGE